MYDLNEIIFENNKKEIAEIEQLVREGLGQNWILNFCELKSFGLDKITIKSLIKYFSEK